MLEIYTDGSAHPNPGPGGFGVVVLKIFNNTKKIWYTYSEQKEYTTNNQMELSAVLYAMRKHGVQVGEASWVYPTRRVEETQMPLTPIPIVYCDSSYTVNTFNKWMFNWANKGWKKSDNQTPENLDIIKEYYKLYQEGYRIDLRKIKGHAGHEWNEMADQLATGKINGENYG